MTATVPSESLTSAPQLPSASTILQHMSVPGEPGTYVLGCFEGRVTIYSQQIRALNLIYALTITGALRPGFRLAVVGGGVAGMTAAFGAAHRGVEVTLFERRPELLHIQRGCHTRWVHPNIYDWPRKGATTSNTNLPFLNWTANTAGDVARQLLEQWDRLKRQVRIREERGVTVALRPQSDNRRRLAITSPRFRDEEYDIVILAVGFGHERTVAPQPLRSYWRDDSLHQPEVGWTTTPTRYLVSGNGDGGLIDLLRLRIRDFRHESLADDLERTSDLTALADKLTKIEDEAWNMYTRGSLLGDYLHREYSRLEVPGGVDELIISRLRKDTQVTFNFPEWPFSIFSSVLNRFLVSRLLQLDDRLDTLLGKITGSEGHEPNITVKVTGATGAYSVKYDRIVVRHGPDSSLANDFPALNERIAPILRARNALDQTRQRIWPENYFTLSSPAAESISGSDTRGGPTSASPDAPLLSPGNTRPPPTEPVAPVPEQIEQGLLITDTVSNEALSLRDQLLAGSVSALDRKLSLLTPSDRRFLVRAIAERAVQDYDAMRSFGALLESNAIEPDAILAALNQLVRATAFSSSIEAKARVLEFPSSMLRRVEESVLRAFFEDIFDIIERDRFGEVNTIVPRIINQDAIPPQLYERYFRVLLKQTRSSSYHGAPAARRGIFSLPKEIATAAINALDIETLCRSEFREILRSFVTANIDSADPDKHDFLGEFLDLPYQSFVRKYYSIEDIPDDNPWDRLHDGPPEDDGPPRG